MNNQRGVTIIEVLIVILIIGIVSGISIPAATTLFTNNQKERVLQEALQIERAAKNFCRQDNYASCPPGTILTLTELDEFLDFVDETYILQVSIGGGIRNFFVYYAKDNEYSFPFNNLGNAIYNVTNGVPYLGAIPSASSRDLINIPNNTEINPAPEWQVNTFGLGDVFYYPDETTLWQVRSGGLQAEPPVAGSTFVVDGPFQQLSINFIIHNTYRTGDRVFYNGKRYEALNDTMSGILPGTQRGWQEITPEWREFNTYKKGDIVYHQGAEFKALEDNLLITPGEPTSYGWQEITVFWRVYNEYKSGDVVFHILEGETIARAFVAKIDLFPPSQEPSLSSEVWDEITDDYLWLAAIIYHAEDIVIYDNLFYRALRTTQGQEPSNSNDWELIEYVLPAG
ncbi:prepilin-type N-terminal cleavage/methylation domain-containing protein [Liberiplasma polymorphum]|uniref:prepilin-type N-terminal cleavage/methylation domain-containing protein n=1 Tax=Liberiplasma polymorphum TaxID=3374570 RepID=UPI003771E4E9